MGPEDIGRDGERIYQEYKEALEPKYSGKIVAIDIDARKILTIGEDVRDANIKAMKVREASHRLYLRRGGADATTLQMR